METAIAELEALVNTEDTLTMRRKGLHTIQRLAEYGADAASRDVGHRLRDPAGGGRAPAAGQLLPRPL